jgi:hypothetical protein
MSTLGRQGRSIRIDARDDALALRTTRGAHTGEEGTAIAMANVLAASRRTDQAMAARVSRRERVVGASFIGATDALLDQVGAGAPGLRAPAFDGPCPGGWPRVRLGRHAQPRKMAPQDVSRTATKAD